MLSIVWRAAAREDLATIIRYIAGRNRAAARELRGLIEGAVRPLAERPYLFRPGRVRGTRKLVVHPNYVVVYLVSTDHIEIVNVLHVSQRYP